MELKTFSYDLTNLREHTHFSCFSVVPLVYLFALPCPQVEPWIIVPLGSCVFWWDDCIFTPLADFIGILQIGQRYRHWKSNSPMTFSKVTISAVGWRFSRGSHVLYSLLLFHFNEEYLWVRKGPSQSRIVSIRKVSDFPVLMHVSVGVEHEWSHSRYEDMHMYNIIEKLNNSFQISARTPCPHRMCIVQLRT